MFSFLKTRQPASVEQFFERLKFISQKKKLFQIFAQKRNENTPIMVSIGSF